MSASETIARELEADIITGRYAPGTRLVERQLAARFRVSPIPVREALHILESRGLVTKRVNCGCTVIDLTAEEMAEMCELRELLEPKAAEWAACRRTEEGLAKLKDRLEQLRTAARSESFTRFFAADLEFHRCLWELAQNPPAARALSTVVGCLFACGLRNESADLKEEFHKHERLYAAVAECRPADAALLLTGISQGFRSQLFRSAQSTAPRKAAK